MASAEFSLAATPSKTFANEAPVTFSVTVNGNVSDYSKFKLVLSFPNIFIFGQLQVHQVKELIEQPAGNLSRLPKTTISLLN
jgi:hypothetical protein